MQKSIGAVGGSKLSVTQATLMIRILLGEMAAGRSPAARYRFEKINWQLLWIMM
jgi:hypothetical protein